MKKLLLTLLLCASTLAHAGQVNAGVKAPAPVALYQGDDALFDGREAGPQNPRHQQAHYNTAEHQININTSANNLEAGGGALVQSIFTEAQRVANAQNPAPGATPEQLRAQAYLIGDEARALQEDFAAINGTGSASATQPTPAAWNATHRQALAANTARVANARPGDLVPLSHHVELVYARHELQGTEPDWENILAGDLGFIKGMGMAVVDNATGVVNLGVAAAKLTVKEANLVLTEFENLLRDPANTGERALAALQQLPEAIKTIPGVVDRIGEAIKHAPAHIQQHFSAIKDIQDPTKKGEAIGNLVGNAFIWAIPASKLARVGVGRAGNKVFKPLGLGSTGRSIPKNLTEKLALEEIMYNPKLGRTVINSLKDDRWLGWTKTRYIHTALDRTETVIHYNVKWVDGVLKAVDDFKFK